MNFISLCVKCLEDKYYVVYVVLCAIFVLLTYYHKKIAPSTRGTVPAKIYAASGNGSGPDRKYHDDDEPETLTSAIPEDIPHVPYKALYRGDSEVVQRSKDFHELMAKRRTVRRFSPEPVPGEALEHIVKTAGTAPSGAHTEPWSFVIVQDKNLKAAIREIIEEEEHLNYLQRMSRQWVQDLVPFATTAVKPYLTEAPVLILVFRQTYSFNSNGKKIMHYYSDSSTAIAVGILLTAIQYCGLVALTSTPMNSGPRVKSLLRRPQNERLELLLPVGRPHEEATVPQLERKPYSELVTIL